MFIGHFANPNAPTVISIAMFEIALTKKDGAALCWKS